MSYTRRLISREIENRLFPKQLQANTFYIKVVHCIHRLMI